MPMTPLIAHFIAEDIEDECVEFVEEVCGIYFRSILIKKGRRARQHDHDYDHATLVGNGSVQLFVNGSDEGVYTAGMAVPILARQRHEFLALEDNTRLVCVHIAASAEAAKTVALLQGG